MTNEEIMKERKLFKEETIVPFLIVTKISEMVQNTHETVSDCFVTCKGTCQSTCKDTCQTLCKGYVKNNGWF